MNLAVYLSLVIDNYNTTSLFLSSENDSNKIANLEDIGLHIVVDTTCACRTQKSTKPDKYK